MAQLTYRSPLEEGITAYDASVQASIASTSALYYANLEADNFRFFNYHLKAEAKKKLSLAGLYLSPHSYLPHSHPACKTLENYMLYSVLPSYIDNTFCCVGIKNSKLDLLKSRNSKLSMVEVVNRYVTSLDRCRYGTDFVRKSSDVIPGLRRHSKGLQGQTLRGLVPEYQRLAGKSMFFHDELHYWTHQDLCCFLEVFKPTNVLATLVFPAELLAGSTRSLFPWCYQYEIVGNKLLFYPDGVRSEGYEQPVSGGYLLQTAKIVLNDGETYCVDVLCSKFAHHLISITRGDGVVPKLRSFGPFDATSAKGLAILNETSAKECLPIAHEVVSKIYRYLRSLKKPDSQSAMAKLSQLVPEPSGLEIKFVQDFSKLVMETSSINSMIKPETFKIFKGKWLQWLPDWLARRFDTVREVALDDFVSSLGPFTYRCSMKTLHQGDELAFADLWDLQSEEQCDLIAKLDGFSGQPRELFPRVAAPHGGPCLTPNRREVLLVVRLDALISVFSKLVARSYLSPDRLEVENSFVEEFVRSVHSRNCGKSGNLVLNSGSLAALLKQSSIERICKRARAQNVRFFREVFQVDPEKWFWSCRRGCTKFLTETGECDHFSLKSQEMFSVIVQRVVNVVKHELDDAPAQSNTNISTIDPMTFAEPWASLPINTSGDSSSDSSGYFEGSLACSCGVNIAVSELITTDRHSFSVRERLRNRSCGWYSKNGVGYSYTGGCHESLGWPDWLVIWMEINGVDATKFNCCLYQLYDEGASIPFHSDDESCFVEDAEILTVNLEGCADFKISCKKGNGSVRLQPYTQFMMPMGFQNTHKHGVFGCTAGRASVTFRQLKNVESPTSATEESATDVPSKDGDAAPSESPAALEGVRRAYEENVGYQDETNFGNGACTESLYSKRGLSISRVFGGHGALWNLVSYLSGVSVDDLIKDFSDSGGWLKSMFENKKPELGEMGFLESNGDTMILFYSSIRLHLSLCVWRNCDAEGKVLDVGEGKKWYDILDMGSGTWCLLDRKDLCVLKAIAASLDRPLSEVHAAVRNHCVKHITENVEKEGIVEMADLVELFDLFDIHAIIDWEGKEVLLNPDGKLVRRFSIANDHMVFDGKTGRGYGSMGLCRPYKLAEELSPTTMQMIQSYCDPMIYNVSKRRVELIVKSLHTGATGVLCSELFNGKKKFLSEEECVDIPGKSIWGIFGTFGAGKSTALSGIVKTCVGKSVVYVSPRKALATEFQNRLGLKTKVGRGHRNKKDVVVKKGTEKWCVRTFEKFLLQLNSLEAQCLIILDEIQLYPSGYLDLVLSLIPGSATLIVAGDPCQSDYDNEKDRILMMQYPSDVQVLLSSNPYRFNVMSQRFQNPNLIARLPCLMLNCQNSKQNAEEYLLMDGIGALSDVPTEFREVVLVSSFDEKKIVEFHGNGHKSVLTFGESTGLTFDNGCILITDVSSSTSEQRWLTALSRFRYNICFVNASSHTLKNLPTVYKGKALGRFLTGSASVEDLRKFLPGNCTFVQQYGPKIGKDEGVKEEKLQGDPWLKAMLYLGQAEDVEEIEELQEVLNEEWFKVHLPQIGLEPLRAQWVHKIMAKEFREMRMGDIVSDQFTDEHSKQLGQQLTNAAERFETIYPRHRANDTVTFIMAVRKRLRFSNPAKEMAKLKQARLYGPYLLQQFLKYVPLTSVHEPLLLAKAVSDFEDKKTSKSAATIENHSERSCSDWLADVGMIFSKSQLCTKFDNRFRNAKAAQSIVCFQHAVLCRFAPYMRYIEMKLQKVLPANLYIHSGKRLEDLNDWVKRGSFDGVCTESDYEAFDASQDQYIMAFELALMEYLGLPRSLINDYIYIKTHLGSKLGNFAIMRFSGEASTFLFNTMANMLFTFQRYEIKGNEFICFAGDDMCASKRLALSRAHEEFLKKLKLKAKVQFTDKPTFCGWNLIPEGIYKKPQLVMERMCIAKETNNLANCIDNYAIEVSYAYRLGEVAINRMSEEEADAMYNCVRIVVKNKHLLKSDVLNYFNVDKAFSLA